MNIEIPDDIITNILRNSIRDKIDELLRYGSESKNNWIGLLKMNSINKSYYSM